MREYGVLHVSFWTDPELSVMSDAANRLMAYYVTGPHTTLIGCFRCPVGYVCSDLRWTADKTATTERELGAALVWRHGEWVLLPTFLRWNAIENPNQGKAAERLFGQVPARINSYGALARALSTQSTLSEPFRNRLAEIVEQFRNQDQDQDPDQTQEQEQKVAGDPKPPRTRKIRPVQQSLVKTEAPTTPVWAAYAAAYERAHGEAPVRNAQVNGQLAQLVKHLGAEEAAAVAAHYLTNPSAFYVAQRHPIGLLLRDYQKLRTEWATGRQINPTTARQHEQTAANPAWAYAQELRRKEQENA